MERRASSLASWGYVIVAVLTSVYNKSVERANLQNTLFTQDPFQRFAREYGVSPKLWEDMFNYRYQLLEYNIGDLQDMFAYKTGRNISRKSLFRWLKRTRVYFSAQRVKAMGIEEVNIDEFFGEDANFVRNHLH